MIWKIILATNEPRETDNRTVANFECNSLRILLLRDITLAADGNVASRHIGLKTKWHTLSLMSLCSND